MAMSDRAKVVIFAALVIVLRVSYFTDAPLWVDYFEGNATSGHDEPDNSTAPPPNGTFHPEISAYFILSSQYLVISLFYGLGLILISIFCPDKITDFDRSYPKKYFLIVGVCQGLSSLFFNFAISGSRTAPYLQAVLSNFNIPIQFTVRFLVLRKRPTWLKMSCAVLIMVAEFVCLLPQIFPELESSTAHRDEGGGTGAAAILWPMCVVASQVPFAVANTVMEKSMKSEGQSSSSMSSADTSRLNIVYFLFWMNLYVFLTTVLLFWADLIPGFGTSSSITDFGQTLWFDVQCLFGGGGCDTAVIVLGWCNYIICILAVFSFASLIRVSEGANFLIIILTIRTPLLFLIWTLFEEHPFRWHPEAHLSTWLSVGAIVVIIPAVIVYDRAPPEKDTSVTRVDVAPSSDDTEPLLSTQHLLAPTEADDLISTQDLMSPSINFVPPLDNDLYVDPSEGSASVNC